MNPILQLFTALFYLLDFVFHMGIPYSRSIFQLQPDKCIVCHLPLKPVFYIFMFLRMKSKVLLVLLVILSTWDWEFFTEYQTYHSDIFIGAVIVFFFFFNFFFK